MSEKGETMLAAVLVENLTSGIRELTLEELRQKIKVEQVPKPKPRSGQVLIKVEKSIINPMDLSTLKGSYGQKDPKATTTSTPVKQQVGYEGCGTVVESGGGLVAWRLVGKRVGFFAKCQAWAEYVVVAATQCIEVNDVPWVNAVASLVNPFTVFAFIELAQLGGHKYILHTAAASALGQMLIKYAKRNGLKVLCVVRKEEQERVCRECGAEYVFNSTAPDFHAKLKAVCQETKCKIGFDAVSGELAGSVLNAMEDGATLHIYGGLSEQPAQISTRDLIFKRKVVQGLWLTDYLRTKSTWGMLKWAWAVPPLLTTDFASPVRKQYPLEQLPEALLDYSTNMQGKILLHCNRDTLNTLDNSTA